MIERSFWINHKQNEMMNESSCLDPLVSVIIPNYNHAQYLEKRFESVLNQTYQNFELIVLDDCSTDNSLDIIERYKDNPHVKHVVINDKNSGSPYKQWNKGMGLATGELVWIAESDDTCSASFVQELVSHFYEGVVLLFCRSTKIDDKGNLSHYYHQDNLKTSYSGDGNKFIHDYMVDRNSVANASSVLFHRKSAQSIDGFWHQSMRGEGDWLLWIKLMRLGDVVFVNQELNQFRFHETNTTQVSFNTGIGDFEHKFVFDFLVSEGFIERNRIWLERKNSIKCYMKKRYATNDINGKVLKNWDRFYIYRILYLMGDTLIRVKRKIKSVCRS